LEAFLKMCVGVLTGGGDVPGLNSGIKALVYGAAERAWQVVGIRRGWGCLLELAPEDPATLSAATLELNRQNALAIDRSGGTFLHTSRVDPDRVRSDKLPRYLIERGDLASESSDGAFDGTLAYAERRSCGVMGGVPSDPAAYRKPSVLQ
jgi:ATP-dependent phosphofructokinase / diphosphate-dependent phosphofructokinase